MDISKTRLTITCFCLFFTPLTADASQSLDLSIHSDTIIRSLNRNTSTQSDADIIPVYEYLQADYNSTLFSQLHGHAYGWYRQDVADHDYFENDTNGELLYGYLEYVSDIRDMDIKLGRQAVYDGPAHENFDGVMVGGNVWSSVKANLYYGLPVGYSESRDFGDDALFGGRLSLQAYPTTASDFGFSYLKIIKDGVDEKELFGIDYLITLPGALPELMGSSNFNILSDDWSEHYIEGNFALADIEFKTYGQYVSLADYIAAVSADELSAPFEKYRLADDEALEIGGEALWHSEAGNDVGGKIKFFDYSKSDETSFFLSALGRLNTFDSTLCWLEIGRMQGEQEKHRYISSDFGIEYRLPIATHVIVATGEFSYLYYDEKIYNTSDSLYASTGLQTSFLNDTLLLHIGLSYASDPYYDTDIQAMLTLQYTFDSLGAEEAEME